MDEARELIVDYAEHPRNYGALAAPTAVQRVTNPLCGDRVTLYLVIADDVITTAQFEGRGCTISQAAAAMLTEQLVGLPVAAAARIERVALLDELGLTLNPARERCATLGVAALQAALAQLGGAPTSAEPRGA